METFKFSGGHLFCLVRVRVRRRQLTPWRADMTPTPTYAENGQIQHIVQHRSSHCPRSEVKMVRFIDDFDDDEAQVSANCTWASMTPTNKFYMHADGGGGATNNSVIIIISI